MNWAMGEGIQRKVEKALPMVYLTDGKAMLISVAVESCHKLSLAPRSKDPDGFFIVAFLLLDSFMKNICFSLCKSCIDLITLIPK